MSDPYSRVDAYLADRLIASDAALEQALVANAEAGLPAMDVAPNQGKLLYILARMIKAQRILEIGTLGAYSTLWLARALTAEGRLVTLEANPTHAEIARSNIERAGLAGIVDLRVGAALQILPTLASEAPFDLIFIDADKPSNPDYLDCSLALSRPGSVIVFDNVVRDGAVANRDSHDANVQGIRRMFDKIAGEPRLTATAIQTVGSKGWDGFAIALVN